MILYTKIAGKLAMFEIDTLDFETAKHLILAECKVESAILQLVK